MLPYGRLEGRPRAGVGYALTLFLLVLATLSSCASPNRRKSEVDGSVGTERTGGRGGGAGGRPGSIDAADATASPSNTPDVSLPEPDPACQPGFHTCGATCVDNLSPATCGRACEPCPTVMGGSATCDGARCGAACPPGKKVCLDTCIDEKAPCENTCPSGRNPCNGLCVDAKGVTACGVACLTCPTDPNGVTSCDGDKCDLVCNAGHHKCGDRCLPDSATTSCGTACSPCAAPTGGTATCDGTKCGSACPTGSKLCAGACIPAGNACNEMCGPGTHDCSGNCVGDNQVNNCGSSCTPCAPPANADATCDGKACGFKCRPGYHRCGDRCLSDSSIDSCGPTSCSRCPTPAAATATCNGVACDFRCDSGRKCHDRCIAEEQPCDNLCGPGRKLCGSTCIVPQAEVCDNRDNDCDGQVDEGLTQDCSNACGTGQRVCSAGTWNATACPKTPSNSDATACGTTCAKCASTDNANGVCQNGTCQLTCKTACTGQPEPCGDCGGTRTCNQSTCTYSACGPSCCPSPVADRWPSLSYSSSPWQIVWPPESSGAAKPTLQSGPPGVVLPRDSVVNRVPVPTGGYVFSFDLAVDTEFAFHIAFSAGGPYPAVRRFGNGPLTLGGLTYGERDESAWKSFGAWNGQTLGGASVKVTVFVKANAQQVAAIAGGIKSGFVSRPALTHLQLIGSHLFLYDASTKLARASSLTGCAGLTDAQVQALYDGNKTYP